MKDKVWKLPLACRVINLGDTQFSVHHDRDGTVVVVIKPRIHCEAIEFADGSVGIEWGPEDGSNIQRKVQLPRGGNSLDQLHASWCECQAASWVLDAGAGWTVVYNPIAHYPGAFIAGTKRLLNDEGFVPGIDGGCPHELD